MTEPLSPPPAAPPPRVNWWRAALLAVGLAYLGCALLFPNDTFAFGHLAVLSLAPFALLILTWRKWRGPVGEPAEAGRLRFRRFWTWVWLAAALASTALFAFGKGWRSDSGTALRLSLALLLLWTSLLLLVLWGVFRALGRREFWRAALRQSLFAAAVLATLIALFYAEENWRGRRQWERFRAEWEAKSVKFSIAEVMPPPVPDDENAAMHPLLKPIYEYSRGTDGRFDQPTWRDTNAMQRLRAFTHYPDAARRQLKGNHVPTLTGTQWRTNGIHVANFNDWPRFLRLDPSYTNAPVAPSPGEDVLRYLSQHDALVAELDEALGRPSCRFPVDYQAERLGTVVLYHLATVKGITTFLSLRAQAAIEAGKPDAALVDMERIYRVIQWLDNEPFLVSFLVTISTHAIATGPIAHGTVGHRWEDRHLRQLDALLDPINMLQVYQSRLRKEAATLTSFHTYHLGNRSALVEHYDSLASQRVSAFDGEPATYSFSPETARFALRYAPAGWLYGFQAKAVGHALAHSSPAFIDPAKRRVHWGARPTGMPRLWMESCWPLPAEAAAITRAGAKAARLQTTVHHARLALALERHWLRHRAYPERLDALVPAFLDRLPHDLFDGQPMRYRREGEQGFVLWSIGFDGKDDNAAPLLTKNTGEETGDLVWRYPQTK